MAVKIRKKYLCTLAISISFLIGLSFFLALRGNFRPGKSPNVLLITIDALRSDSLGSYGCRLETTPVIDRLAKSGVRFTDCSPQYPKTWPSMASLLTGAYPRTTGVRHKLRTLPSSLKTMSEIFKEAGYRTAAVVSNFNIGKTSGFDRGFDFFIESWQEKWQQKAGDKEFKNKLGKVKFFTDARTVNKQALRLLKESDGEKPFFLWLHYMEPHGPYLPPDKYAGLFKGTYEKQPIAKRDLPKYQIQRDRKSNKIIKDLGFYRAQYDREIRYLDDELGRFLSEVEKLGYGDNTLIVITADHGESFGEHGNYYFQHGKLPYQACSAIPLIFQMDGVLPEGKVISNPVGLINVSSTIIEIAGLAIPETFEGRGLFGLMSGTGEAMAPEYVFMESGYQPDLTQLTVRKGQWKLIHVRSPKDRALMTGDEYELYDLLSDPQERNNLAGQKPELVAELSEVLREWYSGGKITVEKGEEIDVDSLEPDSIEILRSLGYIN